MSAEHLVSMANQIGRFYEAYPDRNEALTSAATHLRRFWDLRMRREILRWVDEHHGEGLKDSVRAAIETHRDQLLGGV
jgi:formate dehydrogenase subunit delta